MQKKTARPEDKLAKRFEASARHATGNWTEGMRPFFDVLRDLKLPPRGVAGSRANKQRARIVQNAMKAERRRLVKERAHGKAR